MRVWPAASGSPVRGSALAPVNRSAVCDRGQCLLITGGAGQKQVADTRPMFGSTIRPGAVDPCVDDQGCGRPSSTVLGVRDGELDQGESDEPW